MNTSTDKAKDIYEDMVGTYEHFEDAYLGHYPDDWDSDPMEEYAHTLAKDLGWYDAVPYPSYIDLDAVIRDLEAEGYWEQDGHVFRPV